MSAPGPLTVRQRLAWLADYWRPHRPFAALLVLMTLLSSALAVAFPWVWRLVVDGLDALPPGASLGAVDLARFAGALALIALGRVVVGLYPGLRAWMNLAIEKAVRERVFASILRKDHAFPSRFRTGDLVTRLTEDISDYPRISWFACSGVFRFLDSAARVVFCVGAMLLTCHAGLALLSMAPVPVMLWVFYRTRRELGETYGRQQIAVSRTNDTLEAALSGIRIVKAFDAGEGQERRLAEVLAGRVETQTRLAGLHARLQQAEAAAGRLGQMVVLSLGGWMVLDGHLSLGTLFALHLYLDMLVQPLTDLPNLFVAARQAFVSIDREEEVLRAPEAQRTRAPGRPAPPIDRVALEGATFRWREGLPPALDGVTFTAPRGARVAVVGAVGSGKSTLLRVLAGLLPLEKGTCAYAGVPVEAWDWAALRARIGWVPQEALLFSETVRDNVAFGRPADGAWVDECLRVARMEADLARMKDGAGTRLGRGGTRVSGGQRQRIAIARALAGRPEVLLLDDCTSALDGRTEDLLWEGLETAFPDAIVFLVSHRPTMIRRADTILVLERGRLVDAGTHAELTGRCAAYEDFLLTEERRAHLSGGP